MPSRCSISKCKASKDPLSKHVFKIPKDPAVKSHWIKFFEDNGVTFDETKLVIYRLCAAHFPKDVVEIFGSRARIAMNAIPVHNRNTKKAFVVPPPRSYAYKKLTDETTDANITSLRTTYNTSSTSALKRGPYIKRKQMIIKEVKSFKAKCRCCLKQEVTVKHFEVSPKIENWFSELLQTEVGTLVFLLMCTEVNDFFKSGKRFEKDVNFCPIIEALTKLLFLQFLVRTIRETVKHNLRQMSFRAFCFFIVQRIIFEEPRVVEEHDWTRQRWRRNTRPNDPIGHDNKRRTTGDAIDGGI